MVVDNKKVNIELDLEELREFNFGYYFEDELGQRIYKEVTDLAGTGIQIATVDKFWRLLVELLKVVE